MFPGVTLHVYDNPNAEDCYGCEFCMDVAPVEFVYCVSGKVRVELAHGSAGAMPFTLEEGEGVVSCMQRVRGYSTAEPGVPLQAVALRLGKGELSELARKTQCPFLTRWESAIRRARTVFFEKITLSPPLRVAVQQIYAKLPSGSLRTMFLESKKMELLYLHLNYLSARQGPVRSVTRSVTRSEYRAACEVYRKISQDFASSFRLEELAREVGLTKTRLNAVFRVMHGDTVFGILRRERLEYARRLLEEGEKNITEIAYECGFSSTSHLTKVFADSFGMPPKRYQLGCGRYG
ncbi:helix-turn-helix transcriptional regulator [Nitratidesulfovibrio sp. 1201_IL3209]|uniref:helix-turn-helix transcriptional regulator n=1 Tax=Nitratidesulfovibrio sp. 1201_IL3209 TaxID=3084053 RepID=UPI002FD9C42C